MPAREASSFAAPGQAARVRPAVDDVLAGLGARAGIGPGLLAARLLSTQLRIDAGRDIWAIAIASTCLVAAAALATVVPAMRQAATIPRGSFATPGPPTEEHASDFSGRTRRSPARGVLC